MDLGATCTLVENILLAATVQRLGSVVHGPVKKESEKISEFVNAKEGYYLPTI